jgi:hypothetical protein
MMIGAARMMQADNRSLVSHPFIGTKETAKRERERNLFAGSRTEFYFSESI